MTAEQRHQLWRVVGITFAVVVVLAGLAVVGLAIAFVVALNSFGSNK
jgi:hypothetical protein